MSRARGSETWRWVWPMVVGVLAIVACGRIGERFFDGYLLDLGSIGPPAPGYIRFVTMWGLFGAVASIALGVGFARFAAASDRHGAGAVWSSDTAWLLLGSAAGLLIPLALRRYLLAGAPLADDESAYQFMAELLASGRVQVASPPLKLFFDRVFMINDGALYASYFLGWPALLVPGVWLGIPGAMNAVYASATVPAVFLVARRLVGRTWAKAAVAIYLTSPMLMVGAATELTHTSCLMSLAWMTWFVLRSRDDVAPAWVHAGVASWFSVAFLVRPSVAVGIGAPLLLWWLLGVLKQRTRRAAALAACALPAVVMAALFLAANKAQTGNPLLTPYQAMRTYLEENGYRFAGHTREEVTRFLDFSWRRIAATAPLTFAHAVFRLNFDLFGWPSSLLLCAFALRRRGVAWLWWSVVAYVVLHALIVPLDVGIDSFGPTHYFELAWPILLLNVIGLQSLSERAGFRRWVAAGDSDGGRVGVALLTGMIVATLVGYLPVRFGALARIADNINLPRDAVAAAGIHHAIVFAPRPYAPNCRSEPTRYFVFFRPNNDPDLRNDILWVNHLSVDQDRRLLDHFPDRRGYVMAWMIPCYVRLFPLDELQTGSLPDGFIGGTGQGLD